MSTPTHAARRLLPQDAAEFLGITQPTLYRWVREKRIACFRIGNRITFLPDHLEQFIKNSERPASFEQVAQ